MTKQFEHLKVDKVGYAITDMGAVEYNDEAHVYWDKATHTKAMGVTTLLHDYGEEFDQDFFSKYKAIERIVGIDNFKGGEHDEIRREMLRLREILAYHLAVMNITEETLKEVTDEILDEWAAKNKKSTDLGTEFHLMKEDQAYAKNKELFEALGIDETFTVVDGVEGVNVLDYENAIFPEYLISYKSKKKGYPDVFVCGQVDVLIKKGSELWVLDYKTNEKIEFTGFMGKKMKHPCQKFPDCNYGHYGMQLSMYSHFLEEAFELPVTKTELIHIERDDVDVERKRSKRLEVKRYREFGEGLEGNVVHYKSTYDKKTAKNVILDMHKKLKKEVEESFSLDGLLLL